MSLKFDMEMLGADSVAPVEHDHNNFHSQLIRLIMKAATIMPVAMTTAMKTPRKDMLIPPLGLLER